MYVCMYVYMYACLFVCMFMRVDVCTRGNSELLTIFLRRRGWLCYIKILLDTDTE